LDILPQTLYHWYRNHISDYLPDKEMGCWHPNTLIKADEETGEIITERPPYVFKAENIGERMCIDDKATGHEGLLL
jgi:hypothetical protein